MFALLRQSAARNCFNAAVAALRWHTNCQYTVLLSVLRPKRLQCSASRVQNAALGIKWLTLASNKAIVDAQFLLALCKKSGVVSRHSPDGFPDSIGPLYCAFSRSMQR